MMALKKISVLFVVILLKSCVWYEDTSSQPLYLASPSALPGEVTNIVFFIERSSNNRKFISINLETNERSEISTFDSSAYDFHLSPQGDQLAFMESPIGQSTQTLVIMNVRDQSYQRFSYQDIENYINIQGWTPDGDLLVRMDYQEAMGEGINIKTGIIHPATREIHIIERFYTLPGYYHNSQIYLLGIPTFQPNGHLILYQKSISGNSIPDQAILMDARDGKIVWKNNYTYSGEPIWSKGGDEVILSRLSSDKRFMQIISVTENGKMTELTTSPIQGEYEQFRYFRLSPDQKWIHFTLFYTSDKGPGYILDRDTGKIREIYVGEDEMFISGDWLLNSEEFVYQTKTSLGDVYWILNMKDWTRKKIIGGEKIEYLSQHSVELPE